MELDCDDPPGVDVVADFVAVVLLVSVLVPVAAFSVAVVAFAVADVQRTYYTQWITNFIQYQC